MIENEKHYEQLKIWTDCNARLHKLVTLWQGKFNIVRHENNELRKENRILNMMIGERKKQEPYRYQKEMWWLCEDDLGGQQLINDFYHPKMAGEGGRWTSMTGTYESKEALFINQKILPNRCVECGNLVKSNYHNNEKMIERNMCFGCNLWTDRIESTKRPNVMIVNSCMYTLAPEFKGPGFRGFGGSEFTFKRLDESEVIKSKNVWFGGEIPNRFKSRIPDNAIKL